jgi:hypothetical protein
MDDEEFAAMLLLVLFGTIPFLLGVIASTLLFGAHITLIVFGGLAVLATMIWIVCAITPS